MSESFTPFCISLSLVSPLVGTLVLGGYFLIELVSLLGIAVFDVSVCIMSKLYFFEGQSRNVCPTTKYR